MSTAWTDDEQRRLRHEALVVAQVMLDQEDGDLSRALYQTYMTFRERFLRQRRLTDTTYRDPDSRVAQGWAEAKAAARSLRDYVSGCWASAIINAEHQRDSSLSEEDDLQAAPRTPAQRRPPRPLLSPTRGIAIQDQLEREAVTLGVTRLWTTRGDIPEALYRLRDELRQQLANPQHQSAEALERSHTITQYVHDRWRTMIEAQYDLPKRSNGSPSQGRRPTSANTRNE